MYASFFSSPRFSQNHHLHNHTCLNSSLQTGVTPLLNPPIALAALRKYSQAQSSMAIDYILHESSVGFAIFKVIYQSDVVGNRLKEVQDAVQASYEKAGAG